MTTPVLALVAELTGEDKRKSNAALRKLLALPEEDHEVLEAYLRTTYNSLVRSFLTLHSYPRDYKYCAVDAFMARHGETYRMAVLVALLQDHERVNPTLEAELQAYLLKHTQARGLGKLVSDILVNE